MAVVLGKRFLLNSFVLTVLLVNRSLGPKIPFHEWKMPDLITLNWNLTDVSRINSIVPWASDSKSWPFVTENDHDQGSDGQTGTQCSFSHINDAV